MPDTPPGKAARTAPASPAELRTSRIPGFYRLTVEQRLALLARSFNLTEEELAQLRDGTALRVEHAVNMVENAVGVLGVPLGLGLNFLVNGREYLVPMAIEEASIIAAASKAALLIREGGGFHAEVGDPVMIGQVQVLDLADARAAADLLAARRDEVIAAANGGNPRMVARGGGVFGLECRVLEGPPAAGGSATRPMLVVHLLMDVREAMGANAVNSACEAAGPAIERLTGGRVNLRILSNLADRRLARARFRLPLSKLAAEGMDGVEAGQRMVEAAHLAWVDPYRAATHNKGIFNGVCAAALALGQDWRAIEAGGHAWAARDGQYRSLTSFRVEEGCLTGEIELPLQVGWVGGAVNSHPGVRLLRRISGVRDARELAGLLAAVGLGQNFAACLALSTVGIQRGHMALHARSVALSVGAPPEMVEAIAETMLRRGRVTVTEAETIFRERHAGPLAGPAAAAAPAAPDVIERTARGKVILFGEHATVYGHPGITATIDRGLRVIVRHDPDGPRFLAPDFKQPFPPPKSDQDIRIFSRAADVALEMYGLQHEPIAIRIESDLVPGMGLGSSAAFSVALCSALRRYRDREDGREAAGRIRGRRGWDAELFHEVQRLEGIFHGTPSGMDAATVLSEGVVWFRKGPPREMLPMRLPVAAAGLVCLVEPGARTIEMVRRVLARRAEEPTRVEAIVREIGNLTVDAGIALGTGNLAEAGALMFRNHELLAELGVSSPGLDRAVDLLRSKGVLGAKLTGSGGGGAVIALVEPDRVHAAVESLAGEFAEVFPFALGHPH